MIFASKEQLAGFSLDEFVAHLCDRLDVIKNNPAKKEEVADLKRVMELVVYFVNAFKLTGDKFNNAMDNIYLQSDGILSQDFQGKVLASIGVDIAGDNLMLFIDIVREIKSQFWQFQAVANFLDVALRNLLKNPESYPFCNELSTRKLSRISSLIRKGKIENAIKLAYKIEDDKFVRMLAVEILAFASLIEDGLNIERAWKLIQLASEYPGGRGGLYLLLIDHLGGLGQFDKARELVSQIADPIVRTRMETFIAVHTGNLEDLDGAWESILVNNRGHEIDTSLVMDLVDTYRNGGFISRARENIAKITCELTRRQALKQLNA